MSELLFGCSMQFSFQVWLDLACLLSGSNLVSWFLDSDK